MDLIERYKKLLDRYIGQSRTGDVIRVLHRMATLCEQRGEAGCAQEYQRRAHELTRATPGYERQHVEEATIIPFAPDASPPSAPPALGALVAVDFRQSHLLRRVYGREDSARGFICYMTTSPGQPAQPVQRLFALPTRLKARADSARRAAVWFIRRKLWDQADSHLREAIELSREVRSERALAYSLWLHGVVLLNLEERARLVSTVQELHHLTDRINRPSYRYLSHLLQLKLAIKTEDPLHIALAFASFMESTQETDRDFIYRHPPYRALKSVVDFFIAARDFKMAKEAVNQLKILTPDPSPSPTR